VNWWNFTITKLQ